MTIGNYGTGPLNADGSFVVTFSTGSYTNTMSVSSPPEGGGRTVIRDLKIVWDNGDCPQTYTATKQ